MKKILIIFLVSISIISLSCSKYKLNENPPSQQQVPENSIDNSKQKSFTLDELHSFDGKKGNPAYVAVNGIVYDVSNLKNWRMGVHLGCPDAMAGKDLSNIINLAPHGDRILRRVPIVGVLEK